MSDTGREFDPYRPPDEVLAEPKTASRRPGGLTAIAVIAIVLGCLGLLTGLVGAAGLAFGRQAQQMLTPGNAPGDFQKLQAEMQEELNAVLDKYLPLTATALVVQLVLAASLLVGGIQVLGLKPAGRRILLGACGAAIVFEVARGVLNAVQQMENMAVMTPIFERMAGGARAEMFATFMKLLLYVGLAFGLGIVLAKILYYAIAVAYLRREKVAGLFERT